MAPLPPRHAAGLTRSSPRRPASSSAVTVPTGLSTVLGRSKVAKPRAAVAVPVQALIATPPDSAVVTYVVLAEISVTRANPASVVTISLTYHIAARNSFPNAACGMSGAPSAETMPGEAWMMCRLVTRGPAGFGSYARVRYLDEDHISQRTERACTES